MKIRLTFILGIMFLGLTVLAHAQELTADDLVEKMKSVGVDIDLEQEDQVRSIMDDYAKSINKVNDLIQKRVDQDVINQKLFKINNAFDRKLKSILTDEQMHQWDVEKKNVYKEILSHPDSQNQLQ